MKKIVGKRKNGRRVEVRNAKVEMMVKYRTVEGFQGGGVTIVQWDRGNSPTPRPRSVCICVSFGFYVFYTLLDLILLFEI